MLGEADMLENRSVFQKRSVGYTHSTVGSAVEKCVNSGGDILLRLGFSLM